MRRVLRPLAASVVLLATLMTSCSIREDAAPRPIPESQTGGFGVFATGDIAEGDRTIYLLALAGPGEQEQLRSVRRSTSLTPSALLNSLLRGPNRPELDAGLSTAIPDDLEIISPTRTVGSRLTIDLNDALTKLSDRGLRQALAQIVATVTAIDQVQQVRILVEGENRTWPTGDGEVTDRPLSIYDFPGFVESSQPPYAALPTA